MRTILIVSSGEKADRFFSGALGQSQYDEKVTVRTCGEARRLLAGRSVDLCIINSPLSDESGERLAFQIIGERANQVIAIVRNECFDAVSERLEGAGVFVVQKPLSAQAFYRAYRMAESSFHRLMGAKSENEQLKRMLSEIKTISRAKCLLVEKEFVTEEEAHRMIEKAAMDERKTRGQVAAEIIEKLE